MVAVAVGTWGGGATPTRTVAVATVVFVLGPGGDQTLHTLRVVDAA